MENRRIEIIEICHDIGFENLPYFERIFKEKTGQLPSHFRKAHR